MIEHLHDMLTAAYATRWLFVLVGAIVAGCYFVLVANALSLAEAEIEDLQAENEKLRRRLRIRAARGTGLGEVVELPPRQEVHRG